MDLSIQKNPASDLFIFFYLYLFKDWFPKVPPVTREKSQATANCNHGSGVLRIQHQA